MVKRLPAMQTHVPSLGWEDPLEKEMAPYSSTFAWKIPWSRKDSDKTERLHFHFLYIYIISFIYVFWAVLGLPAARTFSSCSEWGFSLWGLRPSCSSGPAGFRSCGSQTPAHRVVFVARRMSCPVARGISPDRDGARVSCSGRRTPDQ